MVVVGPKGDGGILVFMREKKDGMCMLSLLFLLVFDVIGLVKTNLHGSQYSFTNNQMVDIYSA